MLKLQFYDVTLRNEVTQWTKPVEARNPEQAAILMLKQYTKVYEGLDVYGIYKVVSVKERI